MARKSIREQAYARWKWMLSFLIKDWRLKDYPVVVIKLEPNPDYPPPRFPQYRYRAAIVNGVLMGHGDTAEEARADLAHEFEKVRENLQREGKPMVRPGIRPPIAVFPYDKVSMYPELSEDFIQKVFDLPWAWITDESSLWDFHTEVDNKALYAKIQEFYGVDVSDIESARLWEIFERIQSSRANSPY